MDRRVVLERKYVNCIPNCIPARLVSQWLS